MIPKIHVTFIVREIRRSSKQAFLFIVCMALALSSITAFSGLALSVDSSLAAQARELHAADIIIRSDDRLSPALDAAVQRFVVTNAIQRSGYRQFSSVVRADRVGESLLADIKIVETGYPCYGSVTLQSGRHFDQVLKKGYTIVGQNLLDLLGIKVGDVIEVGYHSLTISDVVVTEPDRPLDVFALGPRVFVSAADQEALGLIDKGSRIRYVTLLKVVDSTAIQALAEQLKRYADSTREHIDTYKTAKSTIKRFMDRFLFFMKLVGFFIMILAGFGIQATLSAFLKEKIYATAIMKTVGASNRFIMTQLFAVLAILGSGGIAAGLAAGYGVQRLLMRLLASLLPAHMEIAMGWLGIGQGIALGIGVVTVFAFLPLYRLRDTRPLMMMRREQEKVHFCVPVWGSVAIAALFFSALIICHLQDIVFSLWVIVGIAILLLITYLLTLGSLLLLRRLPIPQLVIRQAVRGLFRRGSATIQILLSLTASLAVIFTIFLVARNIEETFSHAFPAGVPNLFFLDIQPLQVQAFQQETNFQGAVYPVIRGRITAIAGEEIDPNAPGPPFGDRLSRVFNMTYREELLDTEKLISGESLFQPDWRSQQVSVLDDVLDMKKIKIGDEIVFNIQGVPLKARVSSIRTRTGESTTPFFYFVLPTELLKKAPQTYFSAQRVPQEQIAALQNRIVEKFPNITVIDVSEAAGALSRFLRQLSAVLQLFGALSMTSGLLILISAIVATRAERVLEAVYYKILGATRAFVFKVFTIESMAIGAVAACSALGISQSAAATLCLFAFGIGYNLFMGPSILLASAIIGIVVVVGIIAARGIMNHKPITLLREQADA